MKDMVEGGCGGYQQIKGRARVCRLYRLGKGLWVVDGEVAFKEKNEGCVAEGRKREKKVFKSDMEYQRKDIEYET